MTQRYVWISALAALGLPLLGAELGSAVAARNCQTAADCGGAPATCQLTTYQTCAGKDPACPAGSSCGEKPLPGQTDCAPYVEGICRQPSELPCQVDADCGAGFRCAEQIGMSCVGMGSTGSPGDAPSWHEECRVSRGSFACELNRTPCSVDRDCAAGLSCQQSDANFCHESTCNVDPGCASGLRCKLSEVSYCWTSFASPTTPDAARFLDACTSDPPLLCAPRDFFGVQEAKLPDGGLASSVDEGVTGADGNPAHESPALAGDEAGGDADERSASGDGCSLRGNAQAAWPELSWVALLGGFVYSRVRRRRAA